MDPTSAPVPGAEVKAVNVETGVSVVSRTNDAGAYELLYLQPGSYTLSIAAPGFKTFERKNLQVRVGDRLTEDLTLEVGEVSESITVSGQATLLETATGSLGRVVDTRRIVDLPLPGGNALSLARLAPGVVNLGVPNHPSLGPAVEVLSNLSVNGTRSGSLEFTVDGTPSMWGTNAAYAPPTEAVAEFKVQTATYDAAVGRSPGGNVNVVLRSGTNDFHSTFHWFHNNNKLQSLDLFQRQQLYNPATGPVTAEKKKLANPLNILNRFGFTVSGPVYVPKAFNGRNKTFWMYAFEGLTRPGVERGNAFYTVPDAAQREGDLSRLLALGPAYQIYDPATIAAAPGGRFSRQPLPGNLIPASRISAVARNLMQFWPAPNTVGTADGRNNFRLLPSSWNEFYTHTAKVDHNFSSKHRVFGRYNQTYNQFSSGQVLGTIANGQDRYRRNKGIVFDDIYVITPSLLNDFRSGFTRFEQSFFPLHAGYDINSLGFHPNLKAGISPLALAFPTINMAGYQNLGTGNNSRAFSNYMTVTDDLSWSRGNHTLRTGAEIRVYREHSYNFANMMPTITFGTAWTQGPLDNSPPAPIGQDFAAFLLGIPTGGQINVNDSSAEQSLALGFYVQDDWRLTRTLTLNLGLRWDHDSPITERFNRSVRDFDFNTANPIAATAIANYARNPLPELPVSQFRVNGGLRFAGVGGLSRNLWDGDRNNFAPRIGLAWTPLPSTVIRAGYGVFFVPLGVDRGSVNLSGYSITTNLVASIDNGQTFIASLANPFPGGWAQPKGASGGLSTNVGRGVSFFFPATRNGYMQRYSFGFQRQFPGDAILELTYVGNRGTGLQVSRQYDPVPNSYLSTQPVRDQNTINFLTTQVPNPFFPLLPGTGLAGRNVARQQLLRPYPHFTSISASEPIGYSWYHALQMTAERRLRGGFTAQFNWTWSKFMEATGFRNSGDAFLQEVISDLDRTHRFALSALYELPLGPGKSFLTGNNAVLRQIAGGWQAQAVWQHNTGAPIGFGNVLMVDDIRKARLSGSEQTLDRWFNTAIFNRVPAQQLGSNLLVHSSRFGGLRTGSLDVWDISAVKNFRIAEGWRLQFRAEFLNALNHSNLAGPNTAPTNTLFGRVTATTGFPRYLHFGLKLVH